MSKFSWYGYFMEDSIEKVTINLVWWFTPIILALIGLSQKAGPKFNTSLGYSMRYGHKQSKIKIERGSEMASGKGSYHQIC